MNFLLFLLCLLPTIHSYNIITYLDLVGKSHLAFVGSMVKILKVRGHTVDFMTAELNSAVKWQNVTKARREFGFGFPGVSPWMDVDHLKDPFGPMKPFNNHFFHEVNTKLCRIGLASGEALKFLKEGHYDVALVSEYDYCGFIHMKAANIPSVISYTATNIMHIQSLHIGLPTSVSTSAGWTPSENPFSFASKLNNLIARGKYIFRILPELQRMQTALAREFFGPDFPDVETIAKDIDLTMINSNELIEQPTVISHKVVYIGGMALPKPKPICKELDAMLAKGKKGAVVFSFGTQVPTELIPRHVREAFAKAFEEFPDFTFLWKYEAQPDDGPIFSNSTNVQLIEWLPQSDLLVDPRVKAFITHMGLNSLLEAFFAGKPMVSLPLFADQPHNAKTAVKHGMAVELAKNQITKEKVVDALRKILYDQSFMDSARRHAAILASQPQPVKQRFAEWVELAAKHPGIHKIFNLPDADLDVFTYYCVDLGIAIGVFSLILIYIAFKIIKKLLSISIRVVPVKVKTK